MLNFKIGKIYKDNYGKEWEFVNYNPNHSRPYWFKNHLKGVTKTFQEIENNGEIYVDDGDDTKITFDEVKDWEVGKTYECINSCTQCIAGAYLSKITEGRDEKIYNFKIAGYEIPYGNAKGKMILSWCYYTIFRDGVPQELKNKLQTVESIKKVFQKDQIYEGNWGNKLKFVKRIAINGKIYGIFGKLDESEFYLFKLYKINNVECTLFTTVNYCADNSIRFENENKATEITDYFIQ